MTVPSIWLPSRCSTEETLRRPTAAATCHKSVPPFKKCGLKERNDLLYRRLELKADVEADWLGI